MGGKIVAAQETATPEERATWSGKDYSSATLGGRTIALCRNRLIVPRDADAIKTTILRLAHNATARFTGAERTLVQLQTQARVFWTGMQCMKMCSATLTRASAALMPRWRVGELTPQSRRISTSVTQYRWGQKSKPVG
jgi:hypothetical protein